MLRGLAAALALTTLVTLPDPTTAATNLTRTPDAGESQPAIGWPWVVWSRAVPYGAVGVRQQIFVHDLRSGAERQLPNATGFNRLKPVASASYVLWEQDCEIWGWNAATDAIFKVSFAFPSQGFCRTPAAIAGARFVFVALYGSDYEVLGVDLETSQVVNVSNNESAFDATPHTDGRHVVWVDRVGDEGDRHVFHFDWETLEVEDLTAGLGGSYCMPRVSAPHVVFTSCVVGETANVFLYDIDARTIAELATTEVRQYFPDVSDRLVVWNRVRRSGEPADQLVLHDLDSGVTAVAEGAVPEGSVPAASGRHVVYLGAGEPSSQTQTSLYDVFHVPEPRGGETVALLALALARRARRRGTTGRITHGGNSSAATSSASKASTRRGGA